MKKIADIIKRFLPYIIAFPCMIVSMILFLRAFFMFYYQIGYWLKYGKWPSLPLLNVLSELYNKVEAKFLILSELKKLDR